jgi:hypothetical protein
VRWLEGKLMSLIVVTLGLASLDFVFEEGVLVSTSSFEINL